VVHIERKVTVNMQERSGASYGLISKLHRVMNEKKQTCILNWISPGKTDNMLHLTVTSLPLSHTEYIVILLRMTHGAIVATVILCLVNGVGGGSFLQPPTHQLGNLHIVSHW